MFSILYGLFALFGKIGWDIEYGIDKAQSREKAKQEGRDTYWDKTGKQRLVSNNQQVTTYRNMRGDVMRLDLKGNIVSVVSKYDGGHHEYKTVEECTDKYGNPEYWLNIPTHKNFSVHAERLRDIKTGKYLALKEIRIEDKWEKRGKKYDNYGRTHKFYMDPCTLELVRESDGEIELRNKGYKKAIDIETINKFIADYNKKLHEDYEPTDKSVPQVRMDYTTEWINKAIWEQNRKNDIHE